MRIHRLILGLVVAVCLPAVAVADDIYTRRDARGTPKLTNIPPGENGWRRLHEPAADGPPKIDSRDAAPPRARPYDRTIRRVADHFEVDPLLIHAVIEVESAYDPAAVSPRGALGLMQVMPETAAELGIADARQPHANIVAGTRQLRRLLERYHGNVELALAAYNAGAGAVERHRGVPPYEETRDYIRRVRSRYGGPGFAPGAERDPLVRYVDSRGTLVITQFPEPRRRTDAPGTATADRAR